MGGEFLSCCPKDKFVGHGRREVGKKMVKRVFFHPFDRPVWKTYNFYEKSPFCNGGDPGKHNFSPFCREKCYLMSWGKLSGKPIIANRLY